MQKIPINGLLGSLYGIKMHDTAFLFYFLREARQVSGSFPMPRALSPAILQLHPYIYTHILPKKAPRKGLEGRGAASSPRRGGVRRPER
jgi:hypothetical protein